MSLSEQTRAKIEQQINSDAVVLYMKGTPQQPQCGFSAKTVGILDGLVANYTTVDVLADEEVRQGIKTFSDWPTIPQLYVNGELVGGCDIVTDMYNSGELHDALDLDQPDRTAPEISISELAAEKIKAGMEDHSGLGLHMSIDANWQPQFGLQPVQGGEISSESNGITVLFDLQSAQRAHGAVIDWVEAMDGSGLDVTLPAAPSPVMPMQANELQQSIEDGTAPLIIDVRSQQDRDQVPSLSGALTLDKDTLQALQGRPQDTPMVFVCNVGNSSRGAAEHFRKLGFSAVYNLEGGMAAFSQLS